MQRMRFGRLGFTMSMGAIVVALAPPLFAQSAVEGRVDRLEGEMRAVQRKVFPGGGGQYVQPEIAPAQTIEPIGGGSTSPVADLTARVNALETQMNAVTGQAETNQHRLQLLEDAFAAYRRSTDPRLRALEGGASGISDGAVGAARRDPDGSFTAPAARARLPARAPGSNEGAGSRPPPATDPDRSAPSRDPDRAAAIAAIERPAGDDPGEDAYLYGYRLWQAKYYPEAETQLKTVVATYPHHKRASYARNLLGRSYLDDGKPSLAALAFYDNYKTLPDGDRAPDSLFYLAQALIKANKPASDICKVYGELTDVYGAKISETMKAEVAQGRAEQKCK